ncbi:MAG TPA: peptide deformylase [Steroidobacteraceae bacterium]|nr:peptide deformylase [Steroidobacteraceae bacterium]
MAKLTILEYPDPRLRTKAQPVEAVDDSIRTLVEDMLETMYEAKGIGLAATQVNVHQRVLVTDVSPDRTAPRVFVNPQIIEREGSTEAEEGCLSVPGIFDTLRARAEKIRVRALDRDGVPFELEADGLLAVCIQHEIDHLDGKLFVDYLSELKRNRIRKKLEKERRERVPVSANPARRPVL